MPFGEDRTHVSDSDPAMMTAAEIAAYPSAWSCQGRAQAMARARAAMERTGQWHGTQAMGRRWPVGCVALEITQRCNLDCTLCYLSEASEAVLDLPLSEIFRRIDAIARIWGPGTNVQITGGDPTLRKRADLVAIVRRIKAKGLRCSLFTNGIKASRDLLSELARAGMADVAFHVDLTQERKGYPTEMSLNAVRDDYLNRTRGLGLAVFFNTTIFDGNIHELPGLAAYFAARAGEVDLASFQIQAETGRGVAGGRGDGLGPDRVQAGIEQGLGRGLHFGAPQPGHRSCNRYAIALVSGGRAVPIAAKARFIAEMFERSIGLDPDRSRPLRAFGQICRWLMARPGLIPRAVLWGMGRLAALGPGLIRGRGRIAKLSFMIHNFMDAKALERDRIDGCIFMTMTRDGALPMCLMNARRDAEILKPVTLNTDQGQRLWHPLSGERATNPNGTPPGAVPLSRKTRKGTAKRDTAPVARAKLAAAPNQGESP